MINIKDYSYWYYRADVKFEIIKSLKCREFALLYPNFMDFKKFNTRMLKCHSVQHFDYLLKNLHIIKQEKPYNMYYSLATYQNGIPNQTMHLSERDNSKWISDHYKEMVGYDFLIDIDAEDHKNIDLALESTLLLIKEFNRLDVPFRVVFSGMGFHIMIPQIYIPNISYSPKTQDNIYYLCRLIARRLHDKFSEMIDINIYDSRRLCKVPYSLSLYENDTYVCTPLLTIKSIKDFKLKDYLVENIDFKIRDRGFHTFNAGGNIKKLLKSLNINVQL